MTVQELIENHISENVSQGNISLSEKVLIDQILSDFEINADPSPEWLKNKYHLVFRAIQVIHSSTGKHLDKIQTSDITAIFGAMKRVNYSANYRRQLMSVTKGVLTWMGEEGSYDIDIVKIQKVKLTKPQWKCKSPSDMLTRDEVFDGISACQNPRDAALIALLFDSSCRTIELISLNWNDISFDDRGAKFTTNRKTGYKRSIRLTFSVPYLTKWRQSYPGGDPAGDKPVFCHVNKKDGKAFPRISKDNVDRLMKYLRARTGNIKFKPGVFRPSKITADLADGHELPAVMLKNWGNLKTGMIDKYTNLNEDYLDRQALEMAGMDAPILKEKRRDLGKLKPLFCPHCGFLNVPTAGYCNECGRPLTLDIADKLTQAEKQAELLPEYEQLLAKFRAELVEMQKTTK